jgi:hypothetical protein
MERLMTYTPKVGDQVVCTDDDGQCIKGVVTHPGLLRIILRDKYGMERWIPTDHWTITLVHPDISRWQWALLSGSDTPAWRDSLGKWAWGGTRYTDEELLLVVSGPNWTLTELRPVTP